MPELPEVETMVRGIRSHVVGRRILALRKCPCRCKPIAISPGWRTIVKRTVGRTVEEVTRIGKRPVLKLSGGDALVVEPRMSGLLLLDDPPDRGHLRLRWDFDGPGEFSSLWFWDRRGLGTLTLYTAEELAARLGPPNLGVDALSITAGELRAGCAGTRREIKVALLDQKLVAGIGNLYASEILHLAGIHPRRPADQLSIAQIRKMHAAIGKVLRAAIRHEGSTLSDGTYRNVLNQDGSYQNAHRVYQRAGEACQNCGGAAIERIVQAQRSTFFCPVCQVW